MTALHNLVLLVWSAGMFFYLLWAASGHYARYGWRSLFCAATPEETQGPMQWSLCKHKAKGLLAPNPVALVRSSASSAPGAVSARVTSSGHAVPWGAH